MYDIYLIPKEKNLFKNIFVIVFELHVSLFLVEQMIFYVACAI